MNRIGMHGIEQRSRNQLAKLREALKPFALNGGAISLSKALGHITREHLLAAREALNDNGAP